MRLDPQRAARELLTEVADDPWGQVAVSTYDTARLVALAPWLDGHPERLEFLLRTQHMSAGTASGGWGGPDGYAVVPTLSATAALLTELHRRHLSLGGTGSPHATAHPAAGRDELQVRLARAAQAGMDALRRWLGPDGGMEIPDTIGVELIVPAMIVQINQLAPAALRMPAGFDSTLLEAARARMLSGRLSQRAWACLEVFGAEAAALPYVRPEAGAVGCSAAATAAWQAGPDSDNDFLTRLQARGGGPVPAVTPISYFEPAWVLNSLSIAGLSGTVPAKILDLLESGLTEAGAPAAPGLPPDSDDTAAVLSALLRHGRPRSPDSLLGYQVDGYFTCFPDERNPSVSTNAHILEALALHLAQDPTPRLRAPADMAARWLLEQQLPDGSWQDKWHASPYYASASCVLALRLHGCGSEAIGRAARWLLDSQQADGGWGRWGSTVEETSYAVQILAEESGGVTATGVADAVKRGHAFLSQVHSLAGHPPLWHAKDLYTPIAVIRAAQLAALRLGSAGLNEVSTSASPAPVVAG